MAKREVYVLLHQKNKTCFGIISEYWRVSNYLMKRKRLLSLLSLVTLFILSSCDAIKNLPTNTTGGVFSLNEAWRLTSPTDNNAMSGTTITVYPVVGNATVKTIGNNIYCVRDGDQLWKSVKSNGSGGFTISNLVTACNGTTTFKEGTIAVVNNDQVTVTTRTATNSELIQAWERVKGR